MTASIRSGVKALFCLYALQITETTIVNANTPLDIKSCTLIERLFTFRADQILFAWCVFFLQSQKCKNQMKFHW